MQQPKRQNKYFKWKYKQQKKRLYSLRSFPILGSPFGSHSKQYKDIERKTKQLYQLIQLQPQCKTHDHQTLTTFPLRMTSPWKLCCTNTVTPTWTRHADT